MAAKERNPANFSQQTSALKDAVEDAQGGNQYFVKSFSKSQKAGLKELTKKLEKADSEIAKQRKALDQQLGHARGDGGVIAGTADKLEKALADFQTQQLSLGKEMARRFPRSRHRRCEGQVKPCLRGRLARVHTVFAKRSIS